jgi:hypothetical protein
LALPFTSSTDFLFMDALFFTSSTSYGFLTFFFLFHTFYDWYFF